MSVERVMVAERDSVVETTIIHVQTNEAGDTLRVAQVTERERVRDRAQVVNKEVEVRLVRDTVYVERSDSAFVQKMPDRVGHDGGGRTSAFVSALRWIFWILVCVIVLVVVFKVKGLFNFLKFQFT